MYGMKLQICEPEGKRIGNSMQLKLNRNYEGDKR